MGHDDEYDAAEHAEQCEVEIETKDAEIARLRARVEELSSLLTELRDDLAKMPAILKSYGFKRTPAEVEAMVECITSALASVEKEGV